MPEIRKAMPGDCRGIAEVQVDSYRTAYADSFPQAYFEHFTYEEQEQDWLDLLNKDSDEILLVAVAAGKNKWSATCSPEPRLRSTQDLTRKCLPYMSDKHFNAKGLGRRQENFPRSKPHPITERGLQTQCPCDRLNFILVG